MSHLKSLTFAAAPRGMTLDPIQLRRQRLIDRLETQRRLAADPSHAPTAKRWRKTTDGTKELVERQLRLKPWWRTDAGGNLVLTVRYGLRPIEFEKGKAGIVVGAKDKLDTVLQTLIAAVAAGELDQHLQAVKIPERQGAAKKAAAKTAA